MMRVLAATDAHNIGRSCEELIALANRYDGKDNVTAVLVRCE
jgi:serine/threonine protein phosphatase PrpC